MTISDSFQLAGTTIEDRFRVDSVVGEGGFGIVYRGVHLRLEHPVAVKCLKTPSHFTPEARRLFLDRFRDEGRILLKLSDAPGVPRVFDYGVIQRPDGPIPYLVMEWLDGYTLESMLVTRRAAGLEGLSGEDALQLFLPAVEALAVAHDAQIAHRDIKPANLFIVHGARGPTMKVLDFGIAKAIEDGETLTRAAVHTATSFRAYTPNYAAPEQFAPKRYGRTAPWTDVHALGLVLIELLTDEPAYASDDFVECLEIATSERRPSAKARGAAISDALEAVIQRAVARAPEYRFPNARAFADALRLVPEARAATHGESSIDAHPETERAPGLADAIVRASAPDALPYAATTDVGQAPAVYATEPSLPLNGPLTQVANPVTMGGVSRTSSHGSLVPPVPGQKGRPKSSKRPVLPWALAALFVAGGVGTGAYFLASHGPTKKKKQAPIAPETAPSKKTIFAHDVAFQREPWPVVVTTEEAVAGKNHVRLYEEDGKIVRLERINQAGAVTSTTSFEKTPDGARVRKTYSGRSILLDTATLSPDGVETRIDRSGSTFNASMGCPRITYRFSDNGDVRAETCKDGAGNVIADVNGCPMMVADVDERHVAVAQRCMDAAERPVLDAVGVHQRKAKLDELARLVELSNFGITGEPVADANGCAAIRFSHDGAGNVVKRLCIGLAGLPIRAVGSAAAGTAFTNDANGCVVRETLIGPDGEPVADAGFSARVYARDQFCSELEWSTVGLAGALVARPASPARVAYTLDAQGDEIERRCFGARNEPFNCYGIPFAGPEGSVLRTTRDERGRATVEKGFDHAGAPTKRMPNYPHEQRTTYDDRGLVTEVRFFGPDGQPALALDVAAKRTYRYDELGEQISNAQFGADGAPVVDVTGTHEIRRVFDEKHRLASVELYDTAGRLATKTNIQFGAIVWPINAARLVVVRDGTRVENRFYDAAGRQVGVVDCNVPGQACDK
ncbi:MAG: protein kinase [Polyangiaceae bacterium]|nr:protein kinase [Polyangiaceae bacterium]